MENVLSELRKPKAPKTSEENGKDDGNDSADDAELDEGTDAPKTLHDVHQQAFEKLKVLRQKYGKAEGEDDLDDFDLEDLEDFDLSDDDDYEDDD